jgi:hypothetical protein
LIGIQTILKFAQEHVTPWTPHRPPRPLQVSGTPHSFPMELLKNRFLIEPGLKLSLQKHEICKVFRRFFIAKSEVWVLYVHYSQYISQCSNLTFFANCKDQNIRFREIEGCWFQRSKPFCWITSSFPENWRCKCQNNQI